MMLKSALPVYLASKSPRRKKLLKLLINDFKILNLNYDENFIDHENPAKTVKRLSLEKLAAAKKQVKKGIIITADTIVVINRRILGKPDSMKEATDMLKKLSGRTHTVYTGFSIFNSEKDTTRTNYEKTEVTFRKLDLSEIKEYVKTGSSLDKAGAYGIQDDIGAVFIKRIEGCYYNVVGLPLSKLYQTLKNTI